MRRREPRSVIDVQGERFDAPIFLMGCQRSGTTLLGLILDTHPAVRVVDENEASFHPPSGITYLLDLDRVKRTRPADGTSFAYKAPRDTHRLEEIFGTFADPRVVWITRPPEQVVASMCSLWSQTESWAMTHAQREIRKYLRAFPADRAVATEFRSGLAQEDPRRKEIALATICWICKEKTRSVAVSCHPGSIYCLDYVDLVKRPEASLRRLCRFLALAWHPALLSHHTRQAGRRVGGTVAQRPIDEESLGLWRGSLSAEEQEQVTQILKRLDRS